MTATAPRPAWHLRQQDPTLLDRLATRCGISKVAAAVLANRQLTDLDAVKHLLNPSLHQLRDPLLLPDMRAAVERIQQAIARAETILIHGDYDVDGVTGTTILVKALSFMGAKVRWHIPDRFDEGYGFTMAAVERAKREGVQLIVTADIGVRDHVPVAAAAAAGIDVIGSQLSGREWTLVVRDGSPETIERLRALPGVEILGVDPLSLEDIFKHMARATSGRNEERSQS
jgi:hypothetical protein